MTERDRPPDDGDVDVLVPVAFAATVRKRDVDDALPRAQLLERLRQHDVVVRANGFTYRGVLVGADDSDLYLRGELRALVLPLSSVTSVVAAVVEPFVPSGQSLPEPPSSTARPSGPDDDPTGR